MSPVKEWFVKKQNVEIVATSRYLPEKTVTNFDLEKIMETTAEWIVTRTGIHERRIAAEGESASVMGVKTFNRLRETYDIDPEEIDLIIVATSTPDMVFPATACLIQSEIGAVNAGVFDLSAACSGYVYAFNVASSFIESGMYKTILIVGVERNSAILNWEDRGTAFLFGDGATATLIRATDNPNKGVLATHAQSDGTKSEYLKIPAGGSREPITMDVVEKKRATITMNGREVFKCAVLKFCESVETVIRRAGLTKEDITLIIPHQANIRIIQALAKDLDLPIERFYANISRYGNTSAASIGIALDEALEEGRIKEGDYVIFTAFGAGFSWGSALIRW